MTKGRGLFGGFLVCCFLLGLLVATVQMETSSKPFSFCLPGHRDAVRRLVFLVGLVVSLAFLLICIALLASPSFAGPLSRSITPPEWLILVLGSYFCASVAAYLLGAGVAFSVCRCTWRVGSELDGLGGVHVRHVRWVHDDSVSDPPLAGRRDGSGLGCGPGKLVVAGTSGVVSPQLCHALDGVLRSVGSHPDPEVPQPSMRPASPRTFPRDWTGSSKGRSARAGRPASANTPGGSCTRPVCWSARSGSGFSRSRCWRLPAPRIFRRWLPASSVSFSS